MNRVFLDTDVILDFYIRREPHHSVALRLFTYLKKTKVPCFTSALVVANAYYILSKLKTATYALDKARRLRRLVSVAPLTEAVVDSALNAPNRDFEDTIQLQCALQNGIGTLITRNTKDYPKERVKIIDPLQYLSAAALTKKG